MQLSYLLRYLLHRCEPVDIRPEVCSYRIYLDTYYIDVNPLPYVQKYAAIGFT